MNKIFTTKNGFICLFLLMAGFQMTYAQTKFFKTFSLAEKIQKLKTLQVKNLRNFSIMEIDDTLLKNYLSAAPSEKNTIANGISIEIPMPDGKIESFSIHESSILSPEVQALHPEIKTYKGQGIQHPEYIIRLSITSQGFSAIILGVGGDTVTFEKIKNTNLYKSYFSRDAIMPKKQPGSRGRCGTDRDLVTSVKKFAENKNSTSTAKFTNGGNIKKFRLAIAATGEYTAAFGGGNANNAFNTIAAYANEVNAVYETELGVRLELVSGNNVVYTNAATDPYTATDQIAMLDENNANLNSVIGDINYEVGHVFGAGGSGSGGGVAASPSVCSTGKGRGASDIGDEQSYARVFSIQLIAHEIGHQFGMSHSYNSNIPVCTTRRYTTSVEPGSGATIMSYGFTCSNGDPAYGVTGDDDYSNDYDASNKKIGPFLNFHVVNIHQALDYIATLSCYTTMASGNSIPVINTMQTAYIIPKSTPFYLKGSSNDTNVSDVLSYSWEGTNISDLPDNPDGSKPASLNGSIIYDATHPPFFRSYPPINSGSVPGLRYYPLLSAILDGTNSAKGDKLPSIPITTTHTLTVRDGKGGTATEDITVTVDNSGPFLITNDPTGTHTGASSMNVTWSVNGTNNAPINCKLVDIWLSTDGGYTFTSQLANAVLNNGDANVVLPNINANQARIKVMPSLNTASGNVPNVFFDISNIDFAIINDITLGVKEVNYSDIQIYRDLSNIIVSSDVQIIYSVDLFDRSGRVIYKNSKINAHKVEIPSNAYSKQILIVKVVTTQGKIVTKKMLIN
ncbi:reprolysin-like metallopeptidase [Chryseobacterium joostei]|uniref:reprolysin-like metallopeptidase n=1 Tax=Chryseobacterium joostei TaxID=112234 RepID=UPI003D0C8619